jgi:hypothetical protein
MGLLFIYGIKYFKFLTDLNSPDQNPSFYTNFALARDEKMAILQNFIPF